MMVFIKVDNKKNINGSNAINDEKYILSKPHVYIIY